MRNFECLPTNESKEALKETIQSVKEELDSVNSLLKKKIENQEKSDNHLVVSIKNTDLQRTAITFLRAVIDIFPDPLCVTDDQNRFMIVNKAFCDKSGKLESELIGYSPHELYANLLATTMISENATARKSGSKDGKMHPFSAYSDSTYVTQKRSFEAEDREKFVVCRYQDITSISESKAALQDKVLKLKNSNEDLKNFAYSCSHDLQEPARIVLNFAKLFAERYQDILDEEGKKYLHYILDGAQQMQKMIHDTLSYAKLSNDDRVINAVNCETLLTKILEELNPLIEEFNITITHDPLPTINGDFFKLYQLFQNIISNALKFRNKAAPTIHIGVKPSKSGYTFYVKDNGIGINMHFKEIIFKLFGRLNKSEDYPGTGIGLAICKKIIDRKKGKIWLESEPGVGTTFYFTIPHQKLKPPKCPSVV